MKSIRMFLVVVILAVITLFNFFAALRGYQSSMQEADRLFDKQLLETAKLIANLNVRDVAENIDHGSGIAFQVWREGKRLARSSNAPERAIAPLEQGFGFNNFDGYRWRTVGLHSSSRDVWVLAAERTDQRFALAENVILESIFPILLGIPLVGLLIWVIVGRGLAPLHKLAFELGSRRAEDLSPLSLANSRDELEQIVLSSNALLQRLENSLQREKQFASDAAHELRTPISVLKVQLYNLDQELQGSNKNVRELSNTANRLGHIVEQILDLYRSSPDQYNASFVTLDLSSLAREVIAREYQPFDEKQQNIEFQGEECRILGDKFALNTLLRNLLSNANKYTPVGGEIRITVEKHGGKAVLTVEDSGAGIPQPEAAKVFDRFYRIAGDRHATGESGCGLGLAIVKRIVDLHHAEIEVKPSHFKTGAAFQVLFPLAEVC